MIELQFEIGINTTKETVWSAIFDDTSFRDWANIIDEGTYMVGEMKEGNEIQFISSVNGYGVTSLVSKLIPYEYVLYKHASDTQMSGATTRDKQWTGGSESYTLIEKEGQTFLTIKSEVPEELVDMFNDRLPRAIQRIKELAEEID